MTWVDQGIVAHVGWREGVSDRVGNPITYLVMTRCDKDVIIVVKGMPDSEANPAYVAVAGQVWRFNEVSEEYFISPSH